jgi:cytidylate kinase
VADGRDMGTVVFPQAPLKIFLTASLEERAQRRYNQLKEQGVSASIQSLLRELAERDERDANRKVAPLRPAEDAIMLDSTELSIDEVFKQVITLAASRIGV